MKKLFILALLSLIVLPLIVLADSDDMMGYGMMNGWMVGQFGAGAMFLGLIWVVVISFVFSLIFWLVYKWIVKK